MISSFWLAALVVAQGDAALIRIPGETGLVDVTVEWQDGARALARQSFAAGDRRPGTTEWQALIGIDLDEPVGARVLRVRKVYADGRAEESPFELVVSAESFPETHLQVEQRYVDLSAADQARATAEAEEIAGIYATTTPEQFWLGGFEVPVAGVTGGRNFGHRRFFNGQPRAPHSGADLRATEGTPVLAANAGRVILAKPLFFSGNAIFLDHGMGVYSVYLHLSEFHVKVGDRVRKGDVVGLSGATGRVTGPHLHWGVRIHGARVDPFSLVGLDGQ